MDDAWMSFNSMRQNPGLKSTVFSSYDPIVLGVSAESMQKALDPKNDQDQVTNMIPDQVQMMQGTRCVPS